MKTKEALSVPKREEIQKKIIKGEKAWFRGENRVLNVHLFEHA